MRKALVLVAANLGILLGLLLLVEAGARAVEFVESCLDHRACSYDPFSPNRVGTLGHRFLMPDADLGYVPKPSVSRQVDDPGSKSFGATVTHDARGLRTNGTEPPDGPAILAAGDSFTYGLTVSDDETWPACLERETGRPVVNAGVPGYGAAQALRRAEILSADRPYDKVLLSILVGRDLDRDRYRFHNGMPRPTVVLRDGAPVQEPPPADLRGTPWQSGDLPPGEAAVRWLRRWSILVNRALERSALGGGVLRTELAEDPATIRDVARLAVEGLAALPARHRLLLLQYPRNIGDGSISEEREMLIALAAEAGVPLIDSYDAVRSRPAAEVWSGHHTALGNRLVCDAILASGLLDG